MLSFAIFELIVPWWKLWIWRPLTIFA